MHAPVDDRGWPQAQLGIQNGRWAGLASGLPTGWRQLPTSPVPEIRQPSPPVSVKATARPQRGSLRPLLLICATAPARMPPSMLPPLHVALGWALGAGFARRLRLRPCLCEASRARRHPKGRGLVGGPSIATSSTCCPIQSCADICGKYGSPRTCADVFVAKMPMCMGATAWLAHANAIIHIGTPSPLTHCGRRYARAAGHTALREQPGLLGDIGDASARGWSPADVWIQGSGHRQEPGILG